MLTPKQIEFELAWWRSEPEMEEIYRDLVKSWHIDELRERINAKAVLEVGTGPLGGCLPFVDAPRKVSLEPLYPIFVEHGIQVETPGVENVAEYVEDWKTDERFDLIICANALDHGDSDWSALDAIYNLLSPGGFFCLHVHLRRPDQLNIGHDHALDLNTFGLRRCEVGFKEIAKTIWTIDPWYGKYTALEGVWQK